jgi:phenylalanyl-tRNA synthetase alpha chain
MAVYKLTNEGEEYLRNGLPEKNLALFLNEIPEKTATIGKIVSRIKNFPIALKWALQNGWVAKKADKIILLKPPMAIPEEEALMKISESKKVDKNVLKILIQRNLVEVISETYLKTSELIKKSGGVIDELTHEMLTTGLWKGKNFKKIDVTKVTKKFKKSSEGNFQPYRKVIEEVKEKLISLGFKEAKGPYVELNFWNTDALFMPSDHPARGIHDMFLMKIPKYGKVVNKQLWKRVGDTHKNGWKTGSKGWGSWDEDLARRLVLRSQGTAVSTRTLYNWKKIPYKMFIIDRCFRPEAIDPQHLSDFDQCEGIVVGKKLNLRHLLGYLKAIAKTMGAKKVRFKPSYFPFTEGSVELQVFYDELGWVEAGGSGIFRPEVTMPLGVSVPVLAWGLGIGRLAMLKLKLNDIRYLYSENLQWLRSKR